jgi:hypothetical protein
VSTDRENTTPYGPAGIDGRPKAWKRTIPANDSIVDKIDDRRTNDWEGKVSSCPFDTLS